MQAPVASWLIVSLSLAVTQPQADAESFTRCAVVYSRSS